MGLLGVLIFSSFGLSISMGVFRIAEVAVHSAQVRRVLLAEQDLGKALNSALSKIKDCKYNLRPANLEDATNPTGKKVKSNSLVQNIEGTHPNWNISKLRTLIETGAFKKSVDIKAFKFIQPDTSKPEERELVAFYKRKGLGVFNTRVDTTNTRCDGTDQSACYKHTCRVEYAVVSGAVNKCNLTGCIGGESVLEEQACPAGQYLRGFNRAGELDCVSLAGQTCPSGQYMQGFYATGDLNCVAVKTNVVRKCPKGKRLKGITGEGGVICEGICNEGQLWDDTDCKKCYDECLVHQKWNDSTKTPKCQCVDRCPSGQTWNTKCSICTACVGRQTYNDTTCPGTCTCSFTATTANCSADQRWISSTCQCVSNNCPSATPKWDSDTSTCVPCPDATPKYKSSTNTCEACPDATPKWNGSSCVPCPSNQVWDSRGWCRCPSTTPKWNGSSCVACSSPKIWHSGKRECRCPSENPEYNSSTNTCVPCSSTTPWWTGSRCEACPSTNPWWNGSQCVNGGCSHDQQWNGTECVNRCTAPQIFSNPDFRCVNSCPAWQKVNNITPTRRRCVYKCNINSQVWVSGNTCANCPTRTQSNYGGFYWNGSTCSLCPNNRPLPKRVNGRLSRCEPCSYPTPVYSSINGCTGCGNATPKYDSSTNSCVACPSATPNWNSSTNTCVSSCPSTTPHWDRNTNICVACPSWNSGTNSCDACPSSTPHWNRITNTCVACPDATPKWNGSTCVSE